MEKVQKEIQLLFQSTLPVWGATAFSRLTIKPENNFNPRSPCGERPVCAGCSKILFDFNPRSPCGERPLMLARLLLGAQFQSTLPVWGATNSAIITATARIISIHAPRVGSDLAVDVVHAHACRFQSTLPVWGATCTPCSNFLSYRNFNPRSPCGERPRPSEKRWLSGGFQSTLPVWGATVPAAWAGAALPDFNPRSPCGERLHRFDVAAKPGQFQSTLPVWGATLCQYEHVLASSQISIHAPRVGSDRKAGREAVRSRISIHAPRVGSDDGSRL